MTQPKQLSIKRLKYFRHQFLQESDFTDEQLYHLTMRRDHNRSLHSWGIASGLEVEMAAPRKILVKPGWAVDRDGQEIVLREEELIDLTSIRVDEDFYVAVLYEEEPDDKSPSGAIQECTRTAEFCAIKIPTTNITPPDGSQVMLAKLQLNKNGNVEVDLSIRRMAGSRIAPLTVGTVELIDDSVTEQKLDPALRAALGVRGWVRLPFKPLPLGGAPQQFSLGPVYASSGTAGAGGTVSVLIPPGATRIRIFRLAGKSTALAPTRVDVQLNRGGITANNQPEQTILIRESIPLSPGQTFDKSWTIADSAGTLDAQNHTLGVSVNTTGASDIWLVAAEFQ